MNKDFRRMNACLKFIKSKIGIGIAGGRFCLMNDKKKMKSGGEDCENEILLKIFLITYIRQGYKNLDGKSPLNIFIYLLFINILP